MLAEVSTGLTIAQAHAAPKLYQLRRRHGEQVLVALLVIILRAFIDSLRVPDKPDAADILEMADTLAQTYTHDSLKDIILALKEARTNGSKFYQSLDPARIYALIREYFDRKARFLENQHLDQKARGASQEQHTLQQLQRAAPQLVVGIGRQIPDDHPNAEHLRQRLSLINQKQKRGLLSAAEADQLRAETQTATQRHPRPDWKPNEAAQRAIDHRHRQDAHRFALRHGINPNHI
ncbi:hypothetical protein [Hymenobacter latericus]|uniref:hypothetical protein n=1 Tax=Hymenobacter sp. YIM 151858-1 TaxID=2987688 RepID=UPI002226BC99|nr:hypothetical protein [Hymenobacter sp. YIM 151858-1]UYZ60208.1 hypothetical protein OIS50_05260 [Hymenobacter sp. YIM 151858-1]